jgi:hypothetical protein
MNATKQKQGHMPIRISYKKIIILGAQLNVDEKIDVYSVSYSINGNTKIRRGLFWLPCAYAPII